MASLGVSIFVLDPFLGCYIMVPGGLNEGKPITTLLWRYIWGKGQPSNTACCSSVNNAINSGGGVGRPLK